MGRNCTQRLDSRPKRDRAYTFRLPKAPSNLLTLRFPLVQRLDDPAGHVVGEEILRFGMEGVAEPLSPERSKLSSRRVVPNLSPSVRCLSLRTSTQLIAQALRQSRRRNQLIIQDSAPKCSGCWVCW